MVRRASIIVVGNGLLSYEILGKLTNINSTNVVKPNLTGKKVVRQVAPAPGSIPGISNPQKLVGTFKNDIVIEKDGKYVKAGERILEITQMDGKTVAGSYHEEYRKGFEQYASNKQDFKFAGKLNDGSSPNQDPQGANFVVPGTNIQGDIHFDESVGQVTFYINNAGPSFNAVTKRIDIT